MTKLLGNHCWVGYYKALSDFFQSECQKETFRQKLLVMGDELDDFLNECPFIHELFGCLIERLGDKATVIVNLWNPLTPNRLHLYTYEKFKDKLSAYTQERKDHETDYLFWNELILIDEEAKKQFYLIKISPDFSLDLDEYTRKLCKVASSKEDLARILKEHVKSVSAEQMEKGKYLDRLDKTYFAKGSLYDKFYKGDAKAILFIPAQSNYDFSTGALLIVFEEDHPNANVRDIWRWWSAFSLLQHNISSCADKEIQKYYAMKSAVAAIMGRNMSHNIGSHVLAKISTLDNRELDNAKAKKLFEFIQQRMDFIAQLATSTIVWTIDMNLKEIINGFKEQTYIRDFIADFRGLTSATLDIEANFPSDIEVAIPGGDVGSHALYSLIENILRNAARHGMKDSQETLILSITVEDWNDKYYKLRIKDNCENGDIAENLMVKYSAFIIERKSGQLKSEDWGIKEKKICASYLRLIPAEEIDEKYQQYKANTSRNEEPCIIIPRNDGGHLEYDFYLLKPKKVLVVSDRRTEHNEFKKIGVDFVSPQNFERLDKKAIVHQFLVIDISDRQWIAENVIKKLTRLPLRVCLLGSFDIKLPKNIVTISSFEDLGYIPDKFYEELWKKWVISVYGDYTMGIEQTGISKISTVLRERWNSADIVYSDDDIKTANKQTLILLDHRNIQQGDKLYNDVGCHFPITSGKPLWETLKGIHRKPYIRYEIIEMCAVKVAVVDDRVWAAREKVIPHEKYKDDSMKKLLKWWERKNVVIFNVTKVVKDFAAFVNDEFKSDVFHFLIFHQGEIDEIQERIGEESFNVLWNNLKSKVMLATVVDTGRGTPKQAKKDGLRWMHYSSLQECLIIKANNSLAKKRLINSLFAIKAEGVKQ